MMCEDGETINECAEATVSNTTQNLSIEGPVGVIRTDRGPAQVMDEMHQPVATCASFPIEDGSLMHLYESRLRRLRDYETRVFSRYNTVGNSSPNLQGVEAASTVDKSQPQEEQPWRSTLESLATGITPNIGGQGYVQFYEQTQQSPEVSRPVLLDSPAYMTESLERRDPPSVIQVDDPEGIESLDDITLSTGFISAGGEVARHRARGDDTSSSGNKETGNGVDDIVLSVHKNVVGDTPLPGDSSNEVWGKGTEYSTESSSEDAKNKHSGALGAHAKSDNEEEAPNDPYVYLASSDSKYESYSVLVDTDQEDRAVEIALYSAARPHMRGFHFAWMSFFVAFFTWFAITPLLSEVARSLDLTRKEVWTSSTLAVAGSAVTRILIGPVNDIYGARWSMSGTLIISAIPSAIAGAVVHNATGLYVVRLLIGVAGSAFVTCQFWTSSMFTMEVAGTANSLAAGWGNLGGGVAQVVMGTLLFPLFKVVYGGHSFGGASSSYGIGGENVYDRPADLAWRTAMVVPAILCLLMAYVCICRADDSPKGNFRKRKAQGLMPTESARDAIRRGGFNKNTWLLFLQYGCCFGVEITMTNAAALYFQEEFGQNTESAAAIASVFGWMNLFARGIGGFCSDMASATHGMRGRLWVQVITLLVEGGLVCLFSTTQTLATAIVVMAMFSIFVQAAEGSTFGIVPYVDYSVTGSISGIVGAGGNVGGVCFSLVFREYDNRTAFLWMGCLILASSLLTTLIAIPGHRSLLRGFDAAEVLARRDTHTGQLGSLPNVDLHKYNIDDRNRQSTRRSQSPSVPSLSSSLVQTVPRIDH